MTTLVMKFGGTSVGSAKALSQVAAIVLDHSEKYGRLAVVVSAMSGVTDALTQGALSAATGDDDIEFPYRQFLHRLLVVIP